MKIFHDPYNVESLQSICILGKWFWFKGFLNPKISAASLMMMAVESVFIRLEEIPAFFNLYSKCFYIIFIHTGQNSVSMDLSEPAVASGNGTVIFELFSVGI